MSANETVQENLKSTEPRMKDGEEPTEVLIGLASSPLFPLKNREIVKIMTAKGESGQPIVLVIFDNAEWNDSVGIVLANKLPTLPTPEKKDAVSLPD